MPLSDPLLVDAAQGETDARHVEITLRLVLAMEGITGPAAVTGRRFPLPWNYEEKVEMKPRERPPASPPNDGRLL